MKKKLLVIAGLSLVCFSAVAASASLGLGNERLFAEVTPVNAVWVHYPKREATKDKKGIREYWVNCSTHEHVFSKPESGSISEYTTYDETGFAEDDDRWIYTETLSDQTVLMTDETKSFDLGTDYSGATITSMKAGTIDLGTDASNLNVNSFASNHSDDGIKSVQIDLTKDSKLYSLFFDATFVTANIASVDDFIKYVSPYTESNGSYTGATKTGYFVLTADNLDFHTKIKYAPDPSNNYFCGTFDGGGKTIKMPSSNTYGLFSTLYKATIKDLTIDDYYHNDDPSVCVLARYAKETTLDRVTVKMTGANDAVNGANYDPTVGENRGWLSYTTFQGNTLKDCVFDASNYKLGSLFGNNQNMTAPKCTNCVVKAKVLKQAMYSKYKSKTYQPSNVTLAEGEEAISGLTLTLTAQSE